LFFVFVGFIANEEKDNQKRIPHKLFFNFFCLSSKPLKVKALRLKIFLCFMYYHKVSTVIYGITLCQIK
jgi:hypothetical protein